MPNKASTRLLRITCTLIAVAWLGAASPARAQQGRTAESTRKVFAELLKVPLAPPDVSPVIHGQSTTDGVTLEDITWESLDGEQVPVYVLRPAKQTGRLPAIICLHGSGGSRESTATETFGRADWTHPLGGKPHPRMLGWARELARRGYLTIAITQRGLDRRIPPINQQANVMLVRGRTAMGAVLYEIRQAISYLETRDDVDPRRIGATGMSFGGITAFYVWLLDDRVAAAAPLCGGVGSVDLFSRIGSIGYHGTYWWIPNMLEKGDQADFAAAMAPRPLMLWAPRQDIGMPKAAVDRFIATVGPAYEHAGQRDAFVTHQPPGKHSFTLEAFEAMNDFFDTVFGRQRQR